MFMYLPGEIPAKRMIDSDDSKVDSELTKPGMNV